ncbi:MAG: hypothetical protein HeimC2_40060 [Candidatus Heimdallarchaeota archaeon LC_2]|nr:MAG: hypothetical protein HeimC2_40060 [Candidatus Heimdallarchaeota archaeon LC_2]
MNEKITKDEIKNLVNYSLKKLVKNDYYLLQIDASERSITHKLAHYLQEKIEKDDRFKNISVDTEYNREEKHVKKLHGISTVNNCEECENSRIYQK